MTWFPSDIWLDAPAQVLREENKLLREIIEFQDVRIAALRAEIAELLKRVKPVSLPAEARIEWRN